MMECMEVTTEDLSSGDSIDNNRQNSNKAKSYGWGQTGSYQLGIEPGEDGYVAEPTHLQALDGYTIKDLAIGSRHSLLLTDAGLVSVGCNDHGQLGRETTSGHSGLIDGLASIISVAVGENHSLAFSESGTLYSWGDNQYGQLGRSAGQTSSVPSRVEFGRVCKITQISCGEHHCLALADNGAVYSWGSNKYGQLGHGIGDSHQLPQAIASIRSLNFVKISTGGYHSFALTVSGALFGWGQNSNGQLGLNNCDDKLFPVCCRALRQQRVRHISCGRSHTAVLTKDGGVFTFGAGNHGQLGHNIAQDESLPKKIQELMGSTVTQLSCGRYHTVALVPSSGRLYAFGLGAYGQLGLADTNKNFTPRNIKGPWWTNGINPVSAFCLRMVSAGGNSSLVYVEDKDSPMTPVVDQRVSSSCQLQLSNQTITDIISLANCGGQRLDEEKTRVMNDIFGNLSVWNGAFLTQRDDDVYGCSSSNHGVDLDTAREQLSRLSQCSNSTLCNLLESCIEKQLMASLAGKIPDVESLRVFLILPFLPIFSDPSNYSTIHSIYGKALVSMDSIASKVIDKWLLHLARRHFRYYLFTYKKVITHILLKNPATTELEVLVRQRGMQIGLDVMQKLYKINETENEEQKVSCVDFYIPEIAEKVDIKSDYINWFTKSQVSRQGQPLLSFCNYAFVFDALAKTILLHTDALIQMQQAIDQAHRLNLLNILSSAEIDPVHPCLVITVSRDNLVPDTLSSLNIHGSADLKKPLKVHFKNEEAVDEGGVRKEFFLLLLREVLDLKYGMFQHYDECRLLWFNAVTFEDDMAMYHLIGLLCGLAIYNGTIIDLPFPLALYKKLLGKSITLDDLRELDPILGKSLQDLLDYEEEDVADVFCLTFSISMNVLDEIVTRDLMPNGRDVNVTHENKHEYVNRYVSFIFNESVEKMFQAFHDGFHKVCGSKVLGFFHPLELRSMVVGNEEYDWDELEKNCEYKGEFYRRHGTIDMFWGVFSDLTQTQKKQFLRFLTGCDRIPIQGMKVLKMTIQPMKISDDYLPAAHTCFNLLDLPLKYSSKDKLRMKLIGAIENAEGFGLV